MEWTGSACGGTEWSRSSGVQLVRKIGVDPMYPAAGIIGTLARGDKLAESFSIGQRGLARQPNFLPTSWSWSTHPRMLLIDSAWSQWEKEDRLLPAVLTVACDVRTGALRGSKATTALSESTHTHPPRSISRGRTWNRVQNSTGCNRLNSSGVIHHHDTTCLISSA